MEPESLSGQEVLLDKAALPRSLQDLDSESARLCLVVGQWLKREAIVPHSAAKLIVAFSGGADSTALALVLHLLGYPLVLAHLDHALRPESAAEAEQAQAFALRLGCEAVVLREEVQALAATCGTGLEEAGRRARYRFLEDCRRAHGADWIALGHHRDDLAEDVVMRLVRGAGWPALGGMQQLDRKRHLVRPLLDVDKAALYTFLRQLGVDWIEDPSNRENLFRRNRIRNRVLPLLREENPSLSRSISGLHALAEEDARYWDVLLTPLLQQVRPLQDALFLPREHIIGQPRALRLRLYAALVRQFGQGQARAETLFQLDTACMASRQTRRFRLPGGIQITTNAEGLRVALREPNGFSDKGEAPSESAE